MSAIEHPATALMLRPAVPSPGGYCATGPAPADHDTGPAPAREPQTFTVTNRSGKPGEINLDNAAGGVVAEIETIGPATTAAMTATLASGFYTFKCYLSGQAVTSSAPVRATGTQARPGRQR
jgi:high-affinity iron transporter